MKRKHLNQEIAHAAWRVDQRYGEIARLTRSLRDQLLGRIRKSPLLFAGVVVLLWVGWRQLFRLRKIW